MTHRPDRGFTLIELLIVVAIISVIAAFAVPGLMRAKMTGNEASAITALKATNTAQHAYATACGGGAFASSFTVLGVPPAGTTAAFLSADMTLSATPSKSGYNFQMTDTGPTPGPSDCNGTPTATAFYAKAEPQNFGTTGTRAFAVNAAGTIWQSSTATAPAEPFGPPSIPVK